MLCQAGIARAEAAEAASPPLAILDPRGIGRPEGAFVWDPIEAYFTHLRDIHASGAGLAETSYYGPLATLFTDLGHKLKPKVTAIINLRNTGAGIPDGGLFAASQLKGWNIASDPLQGRACDKPSAANRRLRRSPGHRRGTASNLGDAGA